MKRKMSIKGRITLWYAALIVFIVPLALAGGAVYLFVQKPVLNDATIMLTTGIALAFFGLATFGEGIALGTMHRRARQETKAAGDSTPAKEESLRPLDETDAEVSTDKTE